MGQQIESAHGTNVRSEHKRLSCTREKNENSSPRRVCRICIVSRHGGLNGRRRRSFFSAKVARALPRHRPNRHAELNPETIRFQAQ